ncbi:protein FAR1-RELATED SEQUENCE 2 [Prunus yedoensis var. nudiflora]|uniref:Protein FAR1-RELATED SEQUENCE 2 n=1 Tax=Prunus yedoensis var. nudiflora TaxID=2094558 RepID=A0A314YKV5_PRUYE|nr:protein FAR1-RELATED SEQUENCE 2 [Prunus yedoensis var. nudiflora]
MSCDSTSPERFHVLHDHLTKGSSRIFMEFSVDGDVSGEVVGSSAEVEISRAGDENETGGSSIEGAFQLGQDDKMNQDSPGKDIFHKQFLLYRWFQQMSHMWVKSSKLKQLRMHFIMHMPLVWDS